MSDTPQPDLAPDALVDALVAAQVAKKEAEAAIATLKKELSAYALDQEVGVVNGTDHKVKVTRKTAIQMPPSSDPHRAVVEQRVKDLGYWDRISMITVVGVRKLLAGELPDAHRAELMEHLKEEEAVSISVSKLKKPKPKS